MLSSSVSLLVRWSAKHNNILLVNHNTPRCSLFAFPADPLVLETKISQIGPMMAGAKDFTLTCIVIEVVPGRARYPSAYWRTPSGLPLSEPGIMLTELVRNTTTYMSTLLFNQLHTSHVGLYTCYGRHTHAAVEIVMASLPSPVTVMCELFLVHARNAHIAIAYFLSF